MKKERKERRRENNINQVCSKKYYMESIIFLIYIF
jgi:hypothetical protein